MRDNALTKLVDWTNRRQEIKIDRQIRAIELFSPLAGCFNHRIAASTGRAWSQFVVACARLVRERLGDQEFERQFQQRRKWCRDNCLDDFTIDIFRSGVEYSFVDEEDARQFRLTFC
jgi:hypothetical protein